MSFVVAVNAETEMRVTQISVGFAGEYKTGAWTPVRITVEDAPASTASDLVLTTSDDEGVPCRFRNEQPEIRRLAEGGRRTFEGYVCFGRRPIHLDLELTVGDTTLRERWRPKPSDVIASTQQWVLVVGSRPLANTRQRSFVSAARLLDRPRGQEVRVVRLVDSSELPEAWFGYHGFDMVVVMGSDEASWRQIDRTQWDALDQWAKLGGQVTISAGELAEAFYAADSAAKRFLPGDFSDRRIVAETSKLESFAVATDRLDVTLQKPEWSTRWHTSTGQGGLPMAMLQNPRGNVLVAEESFGESVPLVVRGHHGLGETLFVAMDLDAEPLRQWSGYNKFLIKLLHLTVDHRSRDPDDLGRGRVTHLGFTDISGQLRTALEQYPGVRLVPFALIGFFAIAYALLIGPVEYFGLKRLKDRMHWTWVTFPLAVLAVCTLSLFLVHRSKGTLPRVNQVDLIDWDAESRVVRGRNWTHFFTPNTMAFPCQLKYEAPWDRLTRQAGSLLAWDGLSGRGFGGMDATSPIQPNLAPYTVRLNLAGRYETTGQPSPLAAVASSSIEGLSIPIGSSRAVRGLWWTLSAPDVASDLRAQADTYLSGSFRNPFDVDVRDAAILFERWYYKLGRVSANATVTIDKSDSASSLKAELTGRTVQGDSHAIATWQPSNMDVARIMQMVLFQRAAGGRDYTGLVHRHDGNLDFSPQLASGRAVFVGRIRDRVLQLNGTDFSDDATQRWTFCRVVLPVARFQSNETEPTMPSSETLP